MLKSNDSITNTYERKEETTMKNKSRPKELRLTRNDRRRDFLRIPNLERRAGLCHVGNVPPKLVLRFTHLLCDPSFHVGWHRVGVSRSMRRDQTHVNELHQRPESSRTTNRLRSLR